MKITATGSGGFAGLSERYEIDTETSPAGKALEAALADSGFFAAPAQATPQHAGADLVRWTISVEYGGRQHAVSFVEDGSSDYERWQNLLAHIRAAT
ncbi:MAG TPA: protealysin inhibitor emfourin [Janthinobacterium sp.]|nr:protealysin inhibitor emfourin [Janthinobacterium sp.]